LTEEQLPWGAGFALFNNAVGSSLQFTKNGGTLDGKFTNANGALFTANASATIKGVVFNDGGMTLSGDSPVTLTMGNTFTQTANGTLDFQYYSPTFAGPAKICLITAAGQVSVAGIFSVSGAGNADQKPPKSFDAITSEVGLGGPFNQPNQTWAIGGANYFGLYINKEFSLILKVRSAILLTPSSNPAMAGVPISLTATVSGDPENTALPPTGTVTFYADGSSLGSVPLSGTWDTTVTLDNAATFVTDESHDLTAVYSGDDLYSSASDDVLEQVNLWPSAVTLSVDQSPAIAGLPVTLTATVTGNGPQPPTGTVYFWDGPTYLGQTNPDSDGVATLTTTFFAGNHDLTAIYSGYDLYNGSTSTDVPLTAVQLNTIVALSASDTSPNPAETVTLTAALSWDAGSPNPPSGTVYFYDGPTYLGQTGPDSDGVATLTTTFQAGSHDLTAIYSGDDLYNGSTSNDVPLASVKLNTTVALSTSDGSPTSSESVTLTATLSWDSGSPKPPSGIFYFYDGTTYLGWSGPSNGSGTFTTAFAVGNHSITVIYSGDSTYNGSTSSAVSETVLSLNAGPLGTAPAADELGLPDPTDPGTPSSDPREAQVALVRLDRNAPGALFAVPLNQPFSALAPVLPLGPVTPAAADTDAIESEGVSPETIAKDDTPLDDFGSRSEWGNCLALAPTAAGEAFFASPAAESLGAFLNEDLATTLWDDHGVALLNRQEPVSTV